MNRTILLISSGIVIGLLALTLSFYGNPANMGVCVACFVRDISGGLKLQSTPTVQYMRPEIFGLIIGAFIAALSFKEFKSTAGSAPFVRFTLGFFMMLGCLVFLGCPLRMALRIGGGDLNAVVGLLGLIAGVVVGSFYVNKGFSLPAPQRQKSFDGLMFPLVSLAVFLLFLWQSDLFASSSKGPGASHAPIWMSLGAGLLLGVIVQRTRFCFIGMVKHIVLTRSFGMALGVLALIAVVAVGNVMLGKFNLGFENQPIAHSDGLWNFLSMALVGICGVLLTGCPLRQLAAAGQGNSDAAVSALGMLVGAAVAHNFALASSPAGPTEGGKIIVIVGIVFTLIVASLYSAFLLKRALNKTNDEKADLIAD